MNKFVAACVFLHVLLAANCAHIPLRRQQQVRFPSADNYDRTYDAIFGSYAPQESLAESRLNKRFEQSPDDESVMTSTEFRQENTNIPNMDDVDLRHGAPQLSRRSAQPAVSPSAPQELLEKRQSPDDAAVMTSTEYRQENDNIPNTGDMDLYQSGTELFRRSALPAGRPLAPRDSLDKRQSPAAVYYEAEPQDSQMAADKRDGDDGQNALYQDRMADYDDSSIVDAADRRSYQEQPQEQSHDLHSPYYSGLHPAGVQEFNEAVPEPVEDGSYGNAKRQRLEFQIHGLQGPNSYRFGYDTGKGFNRQFRFEERDNYGNVKGRYGFYDKHGKLQVVNYTATPKGGFHAEGDFGKYPNVHS